MDKVQFLTQMAETVITNTTTSRMALVYHTCTWEIQTATAWRWQLISIQC